MAAWRHPDRIPLKGARKMIEKLDAQWEYVPDEVMGGVSKGLMTQDQIDGNTATRMSGNVSLDNNGGFIQMAFDFRADGGIFDATVWTGLEITLRGNNESYELRLRTADLDQPWQSFRTVFTAPHAWTTCRFPFARLEPYRTQAHLDAKRLRRCGLVAVGRAFEVDLAVQDIALYR
jgi:hypothetical protein